MNSKPFCRIDIWALFIILVLTTIITFGTSARQTLAEQLGFTNDATETSYADHEDSTFAGGDDIEYYY